MFPRSIRASGHATPPRPLSNYASPDSTTTWGAGSRSDSQELIGGPLQMAVAELHNAAVGNVEELSYLHRKLATRKYNALAKDTDLATRCESIKENAKAEIIARGLSPERRGRRSLGARSGLSSGYSSPATAFVTTTRSFSPALLRLRVAQSSSDLHQVLSQQALPLAMGAPPIPVFGSGTALHQVATASSFIVQPPRSASPMRARIESSGAAFFLSPPVPPPSHAPPVYAGAPETTMLSQAWPSSAVPTMDCSRQAGLLKPPIRVRSRSPSPHEASRWSNPLASRVFSVSTSPPPPLSRHSGAARPTRIEWDAPSDQGVGKPAAPFATLRGLRTEAPGGACTSAVVPPSPVGTQVRGIRPPAQAPRENMLCGCSGPMSAVSSTSYGSGGQ